MRAVLESTLNPHQTMPNLLAPMPVYSSPVGTNPHFYGYNYTWGQQFSAFGPEILAGPFSTVNYNLVCITPDGSVHENGTGLYFQLNQMTAMPFFSELDNRLRVLDSYVNFSEAQVYNGNLTQTTSKTLPFLTAQSAYNNPWGMVGLSQGTFQYQHADDEGGAYTYLLSGLMGYIDKSGVISPVPGAYYYKSGTYLFGGSSWLGNGSVSTAAIGFYLPKTGEAVCMNHNNGYGGACKAMKLVVKQVGAVPLGTVTITPINSSAAFMGRLWGGVVIIAPFSGNTGAYYTEDMVNFAPLHDVNNNLIFENIYSDTSARAVNAFGASYIANFGSTYSYQHAAPAAAYILSKGTTFANPNSSGTSYCRC
jgi:hypothetical protein